MVKFCTGRLRNCKITGWGEECEALDTAAGQPRGQPVHRARHDDRIAGTRDVPRLAVITLQPQRAVLALG